MYSPPAASWHLPVLAPFPPRWHHSRVNTFPAFVSFLHFAHFLLFAQGAYFGIAMDEIRESHPGRATFRSFERRPQLLAPLLPRDDGMVRSQQHATTFPPPSFTMS